MHVQIVCTLQVQKELLDNPFKNMVETDSPLLVEPPRLGTSGEKKVKKDAVSTIQMAGIFGGLSVILVLVICCYGRRTKWKLCKHCLSIVEDISKVARRSKTRKTLNTSKRQPRMMKRKQKKKAVTSRLSRRSDRRRSIDSNAPLAHEDDSVSHSLISTPVAAHERSQNDSLMSSLKATPISTYQKSKTDSIKLSSTATPIPTYRESVSPSLNSTPVSAHPRNDSVSMKTSSSVSTKFADGASSLTTVH